MSCTLSSLPVLQVEIPEIIDPLSYSGHTEFTPSPLSGRCRHLGVENLYLKEIYNHRFTKQIAPFTRGAYLVYAEVSKIEALFKPWNEVRGGAHCPDLNVLCAKDGIPCELEIPNEVIAAGLFEEWTLPVLECTLKGPFYWRNNHSLSDEKSGSLQPFVPYAIPFNQLSKKEQTLRIQQFSSETVHHIAIIDLALCNTDRHLGNLLYQTNSGKLYPIDHGSILPQEYASSGQFAWMEWPQAQLPWTPETLLAIAALDATHAKSMILATYPTFPKKSLDTLETNYFLLQEGARRGLTPRQIGSFFVKKQHDQFGSFLTLIYQIRREYAGEHELQSLIRKDISNALDQMERGEIKEFPDPFCNFSHEQDEHL